MRYIIIGAGAVGGSIGGKLFGQGHEVVLVARGKHYDALRTDGLRLATPEGTFTVGVPVVDGPHALEARDDDVLVLATKTQDSAAALDAWAARPTSAPVVCAQNGVENERLALRGFRDVYGMCVRTPATYLEPGLIAVAGSPRPGVLHLGRYPGGVDDTARRIAADLESAGYLAPVVPDVMRWKYGKLVGINLKNAVEAITGPITSEDAREVARLAAEEGEAALRAAGIDFTGAADHAEYQGKFTAAPVEGTDRAGGSTWQSLARSAGSIEVDYLNGEVVLLGRTHGVPTPVNVILQRIANEFARERSAPGELSAAELREFAESVRG
jgi:2-dehydropantoate 2-reductase